VRHRPATALTDTLASKDPVALALWQAQRERTLASVRRIRAGLPSPRLAIHDPWALRGLVMVAMVATFIAAGGERVARIAAAFDWNGVLAPANVRVDAWVTPPLYTGKPPIILSAANKDAATADAAALPVPAGSTLIVRSSGGALDVVLSGAVTEAAPAAEAPQGTNERHFTIAGNGTAHVRAPTGQPVWSFTATSDRPPTIALAKDPERQARGSLQMSYKLEDDYGVTEAHAQFAARASEAKGDKGDKARPLFDPPGFALVLPNARTRNGVGQTVKDLSEDPYAGADVTLTLTARDEAGNEGRSEPFNTRLPERLFTKPLPRALIEQRRNLALDANQSSQVAVALDALLIAPEAFTPEAGQYLGLRSVASQLDRARTDAALRDVVASLWALAVTIEDGDITDVDKALKAAQDALKQALERGASDEEIKKLTENLRAALDKFLKQLAEKMRDNPQQLARPLDPNTKMMRQQDLNNMIERMERLSRSGDKDAAKQLLEQMQQMLENLQMAQPQQGDGEMEQALNELGDMIRKQQQLRDKTFKQGQDSRRDRMRGKPGEQSMGDLQQDQQSLRDRLKKLQDQLAKQGMGKGQKGQKGEKGQGGEQGQGEQGDADGDGDGLGDADNAMGDASGRLGEGNADGAVDSQGRALDALRKGAQALAQAMQPGDGDGQGDGPGNAPGRQQSGGRNSDPLGRPLHGRELGDDLTVKIPGEIDVQRVRRILEELRRRLGDTSRPQLELDYIERLLKDY
ncbi:MAG TPA: TIGR02302 family protein, partial [Tardiphaga sp.]